MARPSDEGQATVELALLLPLVALLAACLVEVGALATDKVRVWHAAREAARVGAVDSDEKSIRAAAEQSGLDPLEISIHPHPEARIQGEPLTVDVTYRPDATIPLVGRLFDRGMLRARATMRIEQP